MSHQRAFDFTSGRTPMLRDWSLHPALLAIAAQLILFACAVAFGQPAPAPSSGQGSNVAQKPAGLHAKPSPAHALAQPEEPAPAAPAPETPQWPADEAPAKPTVTWDSHGLHIGATNSSLREILEDVGTAIGAKVEGIGDDQRVFGDYGPGEARDVLSQLLHGSGYNVLMIGDQGEGTPREIVLSARRSSPANANRSVSDTSDDDTPEQPESEDQPPPPPQPQLINGRMPTPQPGPPEGAPRTPQQILQELQQRQQQMQEQQQQQQPH